MTDDVLSDSRVASVKAQAERELHAFMGSPMHSRAEATLAMITENARLRAEVERLRGLATRAVDEYNEAVLYVDSYFRNKWEMDATLAELRAALAKEGGR